MLGLAFREVPDGWMGEYCDDGDVVFPVICMGTTHIFAQGVGKKGELGGRLHGKE
jgi:hypothetical protein